MPIKTFCLLFFLVITGNQAFADNSVYCPHNSQTIQIGMTQAQVLNACGKPKAQQESQQYGTKKVPVTQWYYKFGSYPSGRGTYQFRAGTNDATSLIISFQNGKVQSISLEGKEMPAATVCSQPINQGDTMAAVNYACGSPAFTNQTYTEISTGQSVKASTWVYQFDPYQPAVTLTFSNGILQSISKN